MMRFLEERNKLYRTALKIETNPEETDFSSVQLQLITNKKLASVGGKVEGSRATQ